MGGTRIERIEVFGHELRYDGHSARGGEALLQLANQRCRQHVLHIVCVAVDVVASDACAIDEE